MALSSSFYSFTHKTELAAGRLQGEDQELESICGNYETDKIWCQLEGSNPPERGSSGGSNGSIGHHFPWYQRIWRYPGHYSVGFRHRRKSKIKNGAVIIFCSGSTGAVTTIEYESGVLEDLKKAIERLAPPISTMLTTGAGATGTASPTCEPQSSALPERPHYPRVLTLEPGSRSSSSISTTGAGEGILRFR